MTSGQGNDLGTFSVLADAGEVAAFRAALGLAEQHAGDVPATYAIRWLAAGEVRAALMTLVSEPDLIPVHEAQTFGYVEPLTCGIVYRMNVRAHRTCAPDRLLVDATISDERGTRHVEMATTLRLISTAEAAP